MTNINALKTQAEYLLSRLEHGKSYVINDLNQRLRKVADENPDDIVIKSVAGVIEKLCKKNPSNIITQGQIEDIYQELIGLNPNTRFRQVLGDLLQSKLNTPKLSNEQFTQAIRDPITEPLNYDIDEKVKSGLDNLFNQTVDTYDPHNADRAKSKVEWELRSLGFDNSRVRLAGGNSRFLVFSADFNTNRGAVPVYIPAESNGNKLPSVFVGSNKFTPLTHNSLSQYVNNAFEKNERLPEVKNVLATLDQMISASPKFVKQNSFEELANSLPKNNESQGLSGPALFAELKDYKPVKDLEIPKTPIPNDLKVLASDIEENVLESGLGFPQSSVRMAKRMVVAELGSMGFKNSQVRISAPTNDGFICEAVLDTPKGKLKIEIPIEMKGNAPLLPSVFAKDDYIADFNAFNLTKLMLKEAGHIENTFDKHLSDMNLPELKDSLYKSASNRDFNSCDEIMEVISKKYNKDVYKSVVSDYCNLLSKISSAKESLKQAYEDSDQFIKTPNSIYPVHKRLGLPAHELIKDENNVWHRRSTYIARQGQKHLDAFFSTSKVLVGD